MKPEYQHLFGPVPSRRLGRSLGVDLTPFKTCTLDCVFCQLGRTTHKTLARRAYVPSGSVRKELRTWVRGGGQADYVTLSGSGEPTLHTRFGDILRLAREETGLPSVLLSNGTLFWLPRVCEAACQADIVKLSLSAWDRPLFEQINRPHPGLNFSRILEGYRRFRDQFLGRLWLEVFLVAGINAIPDEAGKIAELAARIAPDEIHLNTAVRPPAEAFVLPLPRKEMEALAALFTPAATVIAEFTPGAGGDLAAREGAILAMLERRPCTAIQIARAFGMHRNEVSKYVGNLSRTGKLRICKSGGASHYTAAPGTGKHSRT